jgi:asparaginyl-tRNA synthetase
MNRMKIAQLFAAPEKYEGQGMTVCGWARTIRDLKTFGFIELNDGSCFRNLQVVMEAGSLANYREIAGQNVGAALVIRGTVVLTPDAKQPLELKAASIEVAGTFHAGLPPAEKAPHGGVSAHHPASPAPDEPVLRHLPGAERGGLRHP